MVKLKISKPNGRYFHGSFYKFTGLFLAFLVLTFLPTSAYTQEQTENQRETKFDFGSLSEEFIIEADEYYSDLMKNDEATGMEALEAKKNINFGN
ncbi:MAG: hypothetical protein WBA93_16805 [Microcoleaceae cyanobacterium]